MSAGLPERSITGATSAAIVGLPPAAGKRRPLDPAKPPPTEQPLTAGGSSARRGPNGGQGRRVKTYVCRSIVVIVPSLRARFAATGGASEDGIHPCDRRACGA